VLILNRPNYFMTVLLHSSECADMYSTRGFSDEKDLGSSMFAYDDYGGPRDGFSLQLE
jgi:hypothetical protein